MRIIIDSSGMSLPIQNATQQVAFIENWINNLSKETIQL